MLALVGEVRGIERENHPVSEQGAWRSEERWTGLDVQLCQEKALGMIWPSSWVVHVAGQGLGPSLPGPGCGLCMLPRSRCTGLRPQALSAVALPAPEPPVGSWKPWHPALSPEPTRVCPRPLFRLGTSSLAPFRDPHITPWLWYRWTDIPTGVIGHKTGSSRT